MSTAEEKIGCLMVVWFLICAFLSFATTVGVIWLIALGIKALS